VNIEKEYNALVTQYTEKVFNHACRILGNREDAEEATYDVFLRVYYGLKDFRGEAQLSTWIWRITVNLCLSRKRKKNIPTQTLNDDPSSLSFSDTTLEANPELWTQHHERREYLTDMISTLPEREAAVITLFYLEGMGYEEIAEILQIPSGSVATALHRGRERLHKLMQQTKVQL
jgi:RNA polymerase sigma-70 factor (ECF subfamily)